MQGVTGLDLLDLSAMIGRQLPVFSIIVPFWLMAAYVGFRATLAIWPALLVAGVAFALPQFLISNLHGPWLVDVGASVCSMGALVLFLRVWRPRDDWTGEGRPATEGRATRAGAPRWSPPSPPARSPSPSPSACR